MWRRRAHIALALAASAGASVAPAAPSCAADATARYDVVGDAVPAPLDGNTGDAARGRRIVLDRESGNCLICHQLPASGERFQGDLAPSLAGVGGRLSAGQIRLRLIDQSRLNPATLMPPYHRLDGLVRVAPRFAGRPVLTAGEIEDVVAFLVTLREQ